MVNNTVDGKNPANQLRLVVYPIPLYIYKVLDIPGGDRRISSINSMYSEVFAETYKKRTTASFKQSPLQGAWRIITFRKWLISMVSFCPLSRVSLVINGLVFPS